MPAAGNHVRRPERRLTEPLLLGIDIGTASSKGVLAHPDGAIYATAQRPHRFQTPRPGYFEQDAEATWWGDTVWLIRNLLTGIDASQVAAICVSGVGPALVPCDASLRPLRPAILYGIDTRAEAEIEELDDLFGRESILARGGSRLTSQALGPKLLWLQRNEPEVWERMAGWYTTNSFLVAKLTGELAIDRHSASQCDPLYDLDTGDWAVDWCEHVFGDMVLPRLLWPTDVAGLVHGAAALETGLPIDTPVMAGTIDAWAEAFSVAVENAGDLMLMYGSTMFLVQVTATAAPHGQLWLTEGVEPGKRTLSAGMATSGSLTEWVRGVTGNASFAELAHEADAVAPGSDGLLMLPYFAGERSPLYDPDARGVITGLTLSHTRAHLMRAAYESIAFATRHNLEVLGEATAPPTRVVAVGGGLRSGPWAQIVSDVTGMAQIIPTETVGAAYGDARLAAIGSGLISNEAPWAQEDYVIQPNSSVAPAYQRLFELYRQLYPATADVVHASVHQLESVEPSDHAVTPS
jgi:xylulokinase